MLQQCLPDLQQCRFFTLTGPETSDIETGFSSTNIYANARRRNSPGNNAEAEGKRIVFNATSRNLVRFDTVHVSDVHRILRTNNSRRTSLAKSVVVMPKPVNGRRTEVPFIDVCEALYGIRFRARH
jgi:hypothetical protein